MSLVVIVCEDRLREELEVLASEAGYTVPRAAELPAQASDWVRQRLRSRADLALVVSERQGSGSVASLDAAGDRYWLVQAGSPEGPGYRPPARRPHRRLLSLEGSASAYLRQLLDDWRDRDQVRVDCFTFAYRDGLPHEADWVIDTRFLDSPYWIPEMRERPGTDRSVRRYVMAQPGAHELVNEFLPLLARLAPLYQSQRRSVLRVAVGCTGGLHRSMAIASELVDRINSSGTADARYLKAPPLHLPQELD